VRFTVDISRRLVCGCRPARGGAHASTRYRTGRARFAHCSALCALAIDCTLSSTVRLAVGDFIAVSDFLPNVWISQDRRARTFLHREFLRRILNVAGEKGIR
jgi:hypothetical protein